MIQGLVQLFIFQALGELLSKFALPFIPGPVLGLVLLLAFLSLRGYVPPHIDLVGSSILQHLGLLFIPSSVGVVLYLPVLQANAWAISAALVVSVVATVAVTAGLLRVLAKQEPTDE
jgi:holin-like protein